MNNDTPIIKVEPISGGGGNIDDMIKDAEKMAYDAKEEVLKLELYDITDAQVLALAQLVKRIHYSDMRQLSASESETEEMAAAVTKLQRALDEVGYSPR